jgi:EAL domain-containing protein (putative c-di-GMP-specific phosphodiesterase class I)
MFGLGDEVVDSASAGISAKARYIANILSPGSVGEALDEELLRKTLDHRAFSMVFQPIYSLATGALIEVEALARFHATPYRTPDVWFAMAHSVGLGIELELAAIEMALSFLGRIPEQISVAINASPEVIGSSALAVMIESVEPTRIVLELTEQIAVANYQHLSGLLADYRKQGVQLAIDDTGSGFASLSHILKLAPDLIKLDRALTTGIDFDPVRRALAKALQSFSSDTGASIIAEGIETAAELVALQEIGIPYGQGYYLGRPGPVERLKPTFVPLDKSPSVGSKRHTLATSKTPLKGLEISAGVGGLARR